MLSYLEIEAILSNNTLFTTHKKLLLENQNQVEAMKCAALNGWYQALVALLAIGCDARIRNNDGYEPIHFAAMNGYNSAKIMQLLLESGADINTVTRSGSTPLTIAIEKGNSTAVDFLLANNAKINNPQSEKSPLFLAAVRKTEEYDEEHYIGNSASIYHMLASKGAVLENKWIKSTRQHRIHFIGESVGRHASWANCGDLPGLIFGLFGCLSGLVHGVIRSQTRQPIDADKIRRLGVALGEFPEHEKEQAIKDIVKQFEKMQSLATSDSSQELLKLLKEPRLAAADKWTHIKQYINEGYLDFTKKCSYGGESELNTYENVGDHKMFYKNNGKKLYCIIADTILGRINERFNVRITP